MALLSRILLILFRLNTAQLLTRLRKRPNVFESIKLHFFN
jgi:hypothetical protein